MSTTARLARIEDAAKAFKKQTVGGPGCPRCGYPRGAISVCGPDDELALCECGRWSAAGSPLADIARMTGGGGLPQALTDADKERIAVIACRYFKRYPDQESGE